MPSIENVQKVTTLLLNFKKQWQWIWKCAVGQLSFIKLIFACNFQLPLSFQTKAMNLL